MAAGDEELEQARTKTASSLVDADTTPAEAADSPIDRLEAGTRVGRYVIERPLGEGGMGIVYLARDPELDRAVALKFLHAGTDERHRERLLREARSMARLPHPNIVTVHDVGDYHGRVWLAMEYIEGQTLAGRLGDAANPWPEIRPLFLEAGAGLETAHEVGIVHRDFKPENVLVDRAEHVHVADFGLAYSGAGGTISESGERSGGDEPRLTHTGAVMGTPRYMAPEQHRGELVTPAADQFAFCVCLYEGLYGHPPFAGRTLAELADAVTHGRVREPDGDARVPVWLDEVVRRGLRADPDQRFPSMTALLSALEHDPEAARRRRLTIAAVAGSIAVLMGLSAFLFLRGGASAADPCPVPRGIAGWDATARDKVRAAFLASKRTDAAGTFARVADRLDGYVDRWAAARTASCRATHVEHVQSEAILDERMACFDGLAHELTRLVQLFEAASPENVDDAVKITASLSSPQSCEPGSSPLPTEPQARAAVLALNQQAAEIKAMRRVGQDEEAARLLDPMIDKARALHNDWVLGEVLLQRGEARRNLGHLDQAESDFYEAASVATRSRHDRTTALAYLGLLDLASRAPKSAQGPRWAELAAAAIARIGDDVELRIRLHKERAHMLDRKRDLDASVTEYQRALKLAEGMSEPDPLMVATLGEELAKELTDAGRGDDALAQADAAMVAARKAFGERHLIIGSIEEARGGALQAMGRGKEALAAVKHGLEITESYLGPDDPRVCAGLNAVAGVDIALGQYDEALAAYQREISIDTKLYGKDSLEAAMAIHNAGTVLRGLGRLDESLDYVKRAMAIRQRELPPDHLDLVLSYAEMGTNYSRRGKHDQALDYYRKALAIDQKKLRPDHPSIASDLSNIADELGYLGRTKESLGAYRRALDVANKVGSPWGEAMIEMNWGDALQQVGRYAEARALYQQAQAHWQQSSGKDSRLVAYPLFGLGYVELALDHPRRAVPALERALAIRIKVKETDRLTGLTENMLSRALWAGGGDRARARALAKSAVAHLKSAGPTSQGDYDQAVAWLKRLH